MTRAAALLFVTAAAIVWWWGWAALIVVLAILALWFIVAMGCACALGAAIRLRDRHH